MSDVGLGATLQLDIAEALSRIDALAAQIATVTTDIPTSLSEPDASPVTTAIDQAVAAADTTVTPETDATPVTSAIDEAIAAAETTVPVDADTAAAQASIDGLDTNDITVPVDADTSPAEDQIAATVGDAEATDIVLNVTADTGDADEQISAVGDAASGAQEGVDDLSLATAGLTQETGAAADSALNLSGGLSGLAAANDLAGGKVSGLASALGGLGGSSAAAVGGTAAVVTVLGSLFTSGVKATESQQRFTQTFGPLADAVQNVNVGNLNGDLGDLALQLGTSTGGLRDAATKIGQFGSASGVAAPKVAETAEQVLALSLRARALNPQLGQSGDIAITLATALARGGKSLGQFNIGLTASEIADRARLDTGKQSNDQLTQFDRLAAGAALAAERLGGSLSEDLATGADRASIQTARIGVEFARVRADIAKPLVTPILEFLNAVVPLGLAAAQVFGALVTAIIPFIELLSDVAGPVGRFVAGISEIDPALIGLAGGLLAAGAGIGAFLGALTSGIAVANPVLAGFLATVGLFTAATSLLSLGNAKQKADAAEFTDAVKSVTQSLTDQRGELDLSTDAVADYIDTSSRFNTKKQADDLDRLGISAESLAKQLVGSATGFEEFITAGVKAGEFEEIFRSTAEGSDGLVDSLGRIVRKTEDYVEVNGRLFRGNGDLVKSFGLEQDALETAALNTLKAGAINGDFAQSWVTMAEAGLNAVEALKQATSEQDANAQATIAARIASGTLTTAQRDAALQATLAADGTNDYSDALDRLNSDAAITAARQAELAGRVAELATGFPTVVSALAAVQTGAGDADISLLGLATSLQTAKAGGEEFQTVADALGVDVEELTGFVEDANEAVTSFVDEAVGKIPGIGSAFDLARQKAEDAERKLTGRDILKGLNETLKSITDYGKNLQTILGSAYSNLAGFAAQAGPDVVAAIAKSVTDKDGKTLAAIQGNLVTAIPTAFAAASATVQSVAPGFLDTTGVLGGLAADSFGTNFNIAAPTAAQIAAATGIIQAAPSSTTAPAAALGTSTTAAYDGTLNIAGITTGDITSAGRAISAQSPLLSALTGGLGATSSSAFGAKSAPGFKQGTADSINAVKTQLSITGFVAENAAGTAGYAVGKSFSDGMARGIGNSESVGKMAGAAAAAVRAAERAARAEAESQSPSKLFARIGRDLTLGMSIGMGDGTGAIVSAAEALTRAAADAAANGELVVGATVSPFTGAAGVDVANAQSAAGVQFGDITVRVDITGSLTDGEARDVGAAVGDGIIEQVDRRFATDMRLIRRP